MKPGKCPEKKNGARKAKEEGGRRVKGKSQDCCVTFKPNKLSRNFAPAHAHWKLIFASGTKGHEVPACKWLKVSFR